MTGIQGSIFIKASAGIFMALCVSMVSGCNPGAFVSHIEPSARCLTASEDGDTIKVRFKTDNWNVFTIKANGTTVYGWTDSASSDVTDDGKIKVSGGGFTMFYKKTGAKELTLFLQPNFSSAENDIRVLISNNYEEDSLQVRQPASSGYDYVDILYDRPRRLSDENEIISGWGPETIVNNGTDTVFITKGAFAGAVRTVSFTNDTDFGYQGNDFDVPVPDGVLFEDKSLTFSGKEVPYSCTVTYGIPVESDRTVTLSFPPQSTKQTYYRMLWSIDSYEVGYNLRIRNRQTGYIFTINGKMTSTSPDGFYFLTKEQR